MMRKQKSVHHRRLAIHAASIAMTFLFGLACAGKQSRMAEGPQFDQDLPKDASAEQRSYKFYNDGNLPVAITFSCDISRTEGQGAGSISVPGGGTIAIQESCPEGDENCIECYVNEVWLNEKKVLSKPVDDAARRP
jgi:hypothetical protein